MKHTTQHLVHVRREYGQSVLDESVILADPIQQFKAWFDDVLSQHHEDPTAMVLSTVDASGYPDSRVVLLKEVQPSGFVFFTNYLSAKGEQLQHNPRAALNFYWPSLVRQVRVRGVVRKLDPEQSREYFSVRPRESQISAIASPQSKIIPNRDFLEKNCRVIAEQYADNHPVPCPEFWGGYVLDPEVIEFWQGRDSRLHDRLRCMKQEGHWQYERLAP